MGDAAQEVADFVWAHKDDEVAVELIEKKLKLPRSEVVGLFQTMAESGHGTFVPGRRSRPSRIVKAPSRPELPPSPGPVAAQGAGSEKAKLHVEGNASDTSVQVFVLKREIPFRFVAPADITKAEAEKIGKWLELVAEG